MQKIVFKFTNSQFQALGLSIDVLLSKNLALCKYVRTLSMHVIINCFEIQSNVTNSAKTLHVCIFYTSSQKQLSSPDSATDV